MLSETQGLAATCYLTARSRVLRGWLVELFTKFEEKGLLYKSVLKSRYGIYILTSCSDLLAFFLNNRSKYSGPEVPWYNLEVIFQTDPLTFQHSSTGNLMCVLAINIPLGIILTKLWLNPFSSHRVKSCSNIQLKSGANYFHSSGSSHITEVET